MRAAPAASSNWPPAPREGPASLPAALAAAILFGPALARGQDARVAAFHGEVALRAAGAKAFVAVQPGNELLVGDTIRTGSGATAHILFPNGAAVLLGANSRLTVGGEPDRALVDVPLGEFLIGLTRRLSRRQSFSVRLPAAIAAVRGTLFWGKTGKDKTAVLAGFGHQIEVRARGKTVRLKAGQTLTVPYGQPPQAPKPHKIPRSYLDTFAIDDGLQGLDALVDPAIPSGVRPFH